MGSDFFISFAVSFASMLAGILVGRGFLQQKIDRLEIDNALLRQDNDHLYKALTRLTDRDEKGRFVGSKK